jgi:hypothetical protein
MTVLFNHAIIAARDRHESASFFAELFGLDKPTVWGPFALVTLDGGVFLQFAEPVIDDIQMQHYAFSSMTSASMRSTSAWLMAESSTGPTQE